MDRFRTYRGRSGVARRHRSTAAGYQGDKSGKRVIKLVICVALFVIAAFMKLVFPSALQTVGDKLNSVVNYRAALASLGEGISGEKKFAAALGEAFTYAFTGSPADATPAASPSSAQSPGVSGGHPSPSADTAKDSSNTAAASGDDAIQTFSQAGSDPSPAGGGAAAAALPGSTPDGEADAAKSFSDAVISAFMENQEQYSDYAVPAGVSYGMPKLGITYITPVEGVVSSSFGYQLSPTDNKVVFHYGTDISAKTGAPVVAFSDGKVIAAGDSKTIGNYVLISQGGVETQYAHCGKLLVTVGQAVKKGDKIATVGRSGNAAETGLYFQLRVNGVYINPEYYVQWS